MRVFLVTPTRGEPAPEGSIDAIRRGLEALGHELLDNPAGGAAPSVVQQAETRAFIAAVDRMMEADLLVAEASVPSHDVGWAASWFLARGRLVVLCCREDRRAHLSTLLLGNPSPWQKIVVYSTSDDLEKKLVSLLKR